MLFRNSPASILGQNRLWDLAITAFSLAVLLAAAGCGPGLTSATGNSIPQAKPTSIQFNPSTVDFHVQPIGTRSAPQTVELVNPTSRSVAVQSVTVSPANVFAVVEPASKTILAPHASLALSVSFTPPQEASYSGSLTVTTLSRVETNGKRQQVAREITSHYSFPLMGSGSKQSKTVSLSISPATVTLKSQQSSQFTLQASGPSTPAVKWMAALGSVNSSGLYRAPLVSSRSVDTVTAISQTDQSKYATASVTLLPSTSAGSGGGGSTGIGGGGGSTGIGGGGGAGTNYYVSSTGSDTTGDGSQSNPWATLDYADAHLAPGPSGAVVHVTGTLNLTCNQGDGNECVKTTTNGASWSAPIVWQGENGARIHASGIGTQADINFAKNNTFTCATASCEYGNYGTVWANTAQYVEIDGFELECTGPTQTCQHGFVNYTAHVKFHDNFVHDIPAPSGFGAAVNPGGCPIDGPSANWPSHDAAGADCGDVWIERNTVQDIGLFAYCGVYNNGLVPNGICSNSPAGYQQGIVRPLMIGIYANAPFTWVRSNVVHNVPYSWCVTFNHYLYGSVFTNNTVDTCGGPAPNDAGNIGGGFNVSTDETWAISDFLTVTDNIFSNVTGESAITERITAGGQLGPHNDFDNNLFFNNAADLYICHSPQFLNYTTGACAPIMVTDTSNTHSNHPSVYVASDPKYVSPTSNSFQIQASSPASGAGSSNCAPGSGLTECVPTLDRNDNPFEAPPAIGAYQ